MKKERERIAFIACFIFCKTNFVHTQRLCISAWQIQSTLNWLAEPELIKHYNYILVTYVSYLLCICYILCVHISWNRSWVDNEINAAAAISHAASQPLFYYDRAPWHENSNFARTHAVSRRRKKVHPRTREENVEDISKAEEWHWRKRRKSVLSYPLDSLCDLNLFSCLSVCLSVCLHDHNIMHEISSQEISRARDQK